VYTPRDPAIAMVNECEMRRRRRLLRKAHRGDVGALCILRERYHLRLPLIEAASPYTFPWMRREGRGRGPKGGGR
jgi:hypothetical protein